MIHGMMSPGAGLESAFALAFETSGARGSVALGHGSDLIETRPLPSTRRHAVDFLPVVADLCSTHSVNPTEIAIVCVSIGPGSFTGLRIGVTAARMVALANAAIVVPVPTLEVIAQNATEAPEPPDRVAVILDAKRRRVYAATFTRQGNSYSPVGEPAEVEPATFLAACAAEDPRGGVLGPGIAEHREAVRCSGLRVLPEWLFEPRAETVYRLGLGRAHEGGIVDRRAVVPAYVRPPEAEEKWAQRHPGGVM